VVTVNDGGGMTQLAMVARRGRQWWHGGGGFRWRKGRRC